ncbi:MAG: hypothetical protein J2P37_24435, partial [Ktedonobacteraceae bacterium]|nr:hypothetical protein [Ktedonobacteraceae bacterium]
MVFSHAILCAISRAERPLLFRPATPLARPLDSSARNDATRLAFGSSGGKAVTAARSAERRGSHPIDRGLPLLLRHALAIRAK